MRRTRFGTAALLAALLAGMGCVHGYGPMQGGPMPGGAPPIITVPPPGEVPTEMGKIVLPPYVIEAPDNLLIQVFQKGMFPVIDEKGVEQKDAKGDVIKKEGARPLPIQDISGSFQVRLDGSVGLGYWGSVP